MNNEIGRKITSLTLMTIMLAAGFSAFAPSTMPEAAAANANLFVSAENSQFQNYFAGPMVIEVVVIDSDIKDTDKGKGEPDVTVNGNKLTMVQATDGNWYGYFADRAQAQTADDTVKAAGLGANATGLDFGNFCGKNDGSTILGVSMTQTVGFAIATNATGGTNGLTSISDAQCTAISSRSTADNLNNVVRENKTINRGSSTVPIGQIGLTGPAASKAWPFIQLYNFNPTGNVVIQYNKGGGVQTTTLKFDTVDQFAKADLDRSVYPRSAQVHATITDLQLNIDPTDEDSWTFGTTPSNATTYYGIFTEDGALAGTVFTKALTGNLTSLMFEDNGVLKINRNAQSASSNVLELQDNADTVLSSTSVVDVGSQTITNQPVTITESAPNTGIFGTYDESDKSVLAITADAPRGKSATIDYNNAAKSIVVGFGFASVDIALSDAEWNSGESIPVTVTDSDANKNSRADEDLDLNNADSSLIPSLETGDPFTLGESGTESATLISALFLSNFTSGSHTSTTQGNLATTYANTPFQRGSTSTVQKYSERALLNPNATSAGVTAATYTGLVVDLETTGAELLKTIHDPRPGSYTTTTSRFHGFNLVNIDLRGLNSTITNTDIYLLNNTSSQGVLGGTGGPTDDDFSILPGTKYAKIANDVKPQSITLINSTAANNDVIFDGMLDSGSTQYIGLLFNFTRAQIATSAVAGNTTIAADFFSFGYTGDGFQKSERINNQIIRVEVEETGDNTSVFEGTLEYVMLNQLNILDSATYTGLTTIADDPTFIVHQDLDDEEAPRLNYNDLGADGVITQVADQADAPAHSGVVSFDKPTYKIADTVVVTVEDQDLNTDVDLIDIYTVVNSTGDVADNTVGSSGLPSFTNGDALGRLLDITFDDRTWIDTNNACKSTLDDTVSDVGLQATGFTLIETGSASGIFTGDFQVPAKVCRPADAQTGGSADTSPVNTQGLDMEVNYVDFRDASGQIVEVGDGAGIRANTGSVSLDRTVYPVPWGAIGDFDTPTDNTSPGGRSIFPVHLTGIGTNGIQAAETLGEGVLTVHVQVNDPDFDTSASGEDKIAQNVTGTKKGPVKVTVSRGNSQVILGYAGGDIIKNGVIDVGADNTGNGVSSVRQLGPITETAPSSGIFEFDLDITHNDGPASTTCPATTTYDSLLTPGTTSTTETTRFDTASSTGDYCILQGDILTVEYTDPADASGDQNTVTDSATFDLRNGALQSDKSVYIIGSDMILTLIEPDFDLDNDLAETFDLDLIEWDSDAATLTMGNLGGSSASFDPEPSDLRETGDSTGIFQTVVEIPKVLSNDNLERGEEIVLEYTDWGPSGADYVGQEDEDVNLTVFTSNFGATVELDQKVYTWTDKVYITVVAPDHNFDSNLVDEIGTQSADPLKVATRGHSLDRYKLVETGTDTGIFTGEVILTGFAHDANDDGTTTDAPNTTTPLTGGGPTNGFLQADDDDGLTVSYEFSEDETVVGSALIRWNIGEVAWLEASYPASGTGVVRVIDPDMNLNPEAVDNFATDVWSDSDAGGIDLTVTETNEATGIFEGTVFFTTTDASSGHRLRVAEGDTVTAEYHDQTLPDPYTRADELDITGTAFIGTVVPPLERAPASNARVVDAFGNTLDEVSVDQQVQITADLTNGQDREQPFAYLVQIQNEDGVTVSLAWITGSLSAGQSFSPALSWIPTEAGTYTATVFVWESVDNPTALSPPVSVDITVS